MATRLKTRIRHKIDIEENWINNNPILKKGEIGFTSDGEYRNFFKIGDGVTPWVSLQYAYSEFLANLINVDNLTIEKTENGIAIKDTGVVAGTYTAEYDNSSEVFTIPSFTVNAKGQLTEVTDKRVQIKQTINVIPVTGRAYTIESNHALIAGKSTSSASCIINVPKMPNGTQVVIKNTSPEYSMIVRPKNVSIDNYTGDIILAPFEYITLVAISTTMWSIISESSRFDTTKLATLALDSNVIVRTDDTGNQEQNISTMNMGTESIATI
mgnify:CR=1 FL=1